MLGACAEIPVEGPQSYVVRPDDTLYSIAWRHDLDFRDLARWNNLGADFRIRVGQVLILGPGRAPSTEFEKPRAASVPARASQTAAASRAEETPRVGKPHPLPERQATASNPANSTVPRTAANLRDKSSPFSDSPSERNVGALKWVWPTERRGAPRPVPGGGILLSGHLGQDVRAASAGRVVYAGSGLRGYGNLIIIKHADSLLSAYAHNREMLVRDGQEVAMGQVIAHMGKGVHQSPILYFEIRQNGRPVDPMPFLPR